MRVKKLRGQCGGGWEDVGRFGLGFIEDEKKRKIIDCIF
jgi:hypothetical protein